jgi:hypothetical protein
MSIKLKVILSVIVVLLLGTIGLLWISNQTYNKNIELIAKRSLSTAKESFTNLQKNDLKMMTALVEELAVNPEIKTAFMTQNRERLMELTIPRYKDYKEKYGVTQWNFMDSSSENLMVLRLTLPKKFGDPISRKTLKNAVKSGKNSFGTELGNTGFAIRVVKPWYDNGKVIGYMEMGEEINRFVRVLKELTGNDFGLILKKQYLKASDWETTRLALNLKNNWDDQKEFVIATNTSEEEGFLKYEGAFEQLPEEGQIIGEVRHGDSVFIKGIFPIIDISNRKVGGLFVLQNITDIYAGMKEAQNKTILFIIIQAVFICFVIIYILIRLVFRRLNIMIDKATRVIGGDYYNSIDTKSKDEVGQFEYLFDQFRIVFVSVLEQSQNIGKY